MRSPRMLALGLVTTVVALSLSGPHDALAQSEAPATGSGGLEICLDANGEPRTGEIDVLLLIDDSGSLAATGNPTDPDGRRFEAIETLLDGLVVTVDPERTVNVGAMSFGQRVDVLSTFAPIAELEISAVVRGIRDRATGRQSLTDYVSGMSRALAVLADRPVENCRFLVWFTDGGHDASNSRTAEADASEASDLRSSFCGPGGTVELARSLGVNVFVLLLAPAADNPLRLEASKDVMQALTGDRAPRFPGDASARRDPSGSCGALMGPRNGLVLPVAGASQLPGIFADLPNLIDGGVAPVECPYRLDDVATGGLPAGHLIDWISLTDYAATTAGSVPTLDNLLVRVGEELLDARGVLSKLSSNPPSVRFRIREDARAGLTPGWSLTVRSAQDLCLRVRPAVPEFRISTSEPRVRVVSPRGLPTELFAEGQLQLRPRGSGDASPISIDEALRSPGVTGRLEVDFGAIFSDDSTIPVRVSIDGAPVQSDGCVSLQVPAPGSLRSTGSGSGPSEAPVDPVRSSDCLITPATFGDGGALSWAATLAQINADDFECPVGDWAVFVDGVEAAAPSLTLLPGGEPVLLELRSRAPPPNEELDCAGVSVTPIVLEWQGRTTEIPVTLSVSWLRRSSLRIAALIATPIAAAVAFLSFLVLWGLNEALMRPPDPSTLWGFEASGRLTIDASGRGTIRWDEGDASLAVSAASFGRVAEQGRGGLRVESGARLERRMPPFLRPLAEPVLELASESGERVVVGHPSAPRGRGTLPLGFRQAIALSASAGARPAPGGEIGVRLLVLVPRDADVAGQDSVQRLVDHHLGTLVDRLLERLRSKDAADGKEAHKTLGADGPVSGPAFDGAPPSIDDWGGPPPIGGPPA